MTITEQQYMLYETLFGLRNAIAVLPVTTVEEFETELRNVDRALRELRVKVENHPEIAEAEYA